MRYRLATVDRSAAWILFMLVAVGTGAAGCGASDETSPNASPEKGDASTSGSNTTPGTNQGNDHGTSSGGTPSKPTSTWTPPTTDGPPATCTNSSKSFGGLSVIECVPKGGEGKTGKAAPLVVALHGYTQSAQAYEDTTEWHVLAGRYGFYVIYPSAPGSRSWTWFGSDRARGQADAKAIVDMVDEMKSSHDILPDMVFVTGLSAGGYETLVMLSDYPDVFSAGAAVAGGPYGCTTACMSSANADPAAVKAAFPTWWNDGSSRKPRLFVIQGDKDNIVSPTNLQATVDQWAAATGTDKTPSNTKLGISDQLKGYPYKVYSKDGSTVNLASLSITGMAHATPVEPGNGDDQGGKTGSYAASVKIYSPYYIAKFFGIIP